MVQTDISQLSAECADWRQIIRNYREEFHDCEKSLVHMCTVSLSKNHFAAVEHFQNQFDIQLKNIHDLKQQIKLHQRKVEIDSGGEELYLEHEHLLNEFLSLENTLQELREDFRNFINSTSC